MSVKTVIVAAGLVAGATTAAFAQEGWVGVAGPGAPSYGFGCYSCGAGTGGAVYNQAAPNGALLDYAGPAPDGGGLVPDYAPVHTPRGLFTPAATIFGSVRMGLAAATAPNRSARRCKSKLGHTRCSSMGRLRRCRIRQDPPRCGQQLLLPPCYEMK